MSWKKLFKAATKPTPTSKGTRPPRPIGERILVQGGRGTPIFKEDWEAFSGPHDETARQYLKQAKAFARIPEAKVTDMLLTEGKHVLAQCQEWLERFEMEYDTFYLDTDAASARAARLYDLVFAAEIELDTAVQDLQDAFDWRNNPDNPDNEA